MAPWRRARRNSRRSASVYGYAAVTVISDSSAVRTEARQFAQHQAALTVLQRLLSAPGTDRLAWLDLACGRGQILTALRDNLSDQARAKLQFSAYDVKQEYVTETRQTAEGLGFAVVSGQVGELKDFDALVPSEGRFGFITLTNTVHEVAVEHIAQVLCDAIARLDERGTLFVYDMERVKPPELGALPFSADDFRTVALALVSALGEDDYQPEVGRWRHSTVNGWNLQIEREHINITNQQLADRRLRAVNHTQAALLAILRRRLTECRAALEKLTQYGAGTAEEQDYREDLLYELWAVTRSLEASA
jgi:SAM-dependent methyltransferase